MCLFPILILIIQSLCFPVSQAHSKTISLPWKMTALFLSLLYLCMSSMTEVLKEKLPLTIKLFLLLCSFMACYLLLLRIGNFSPKKAVLPVTFRKIGKTPVYLVMIPITLLSIFIIAGCYPGVFSTDSASNWNDVATNTFSNWHPVTYLYILKIIQRIFGNPFPLVILQTLLWLFASQYAVYLLEKYTSIRYGDILYTLFSVIFIYSYRALGNIEKDTLWNIALFLFCLFLFDFIKSKQLFAWYKIMGFTLIACMVCTIRHMGNVIVLITLLALLLYEWKSKYTDTKKRKKQLLFLLGVSILIPVFLINILGSHVLHMVPNEEYVKYSVPVSMAGAVASKETLDAEDIAVLEEIMPLEKWQSCYDKYYADSLSRTWGAIGDDALKLRDKDFQKKILLLNAKFLFKYPVTYLTAYFDMTSIIWEMGTPADGYEWIPVTIYSSALDNYPGLAELQIQSNLSTRIQQNFFGHSDQIPVWSSICWRGGFSIFVLLVCSCLLIKKKRSRELLALLPALLLTGILFLANPSQDPRYIDSYHMLMCFFLLVASSSEGGSNRG